MNSKYPPWLDGAGEPYTTAQLFEVTKTWSEEVWALYADSLEVRQRESTSRKYEKIIDEYSNQLTLLPDGEEEGDPDYSRLRLLFAQLGALDQAILESSIIDHVSDENIAENLQITRRAVMTSKEKSLQFLKEKLTRPDTFNFSKPNQLENQSVKHFQNPERAVAGRF